MDYLRITEGVNADPRYGGFTPAQWCCLALTAFGLGMVALMFRHRARGYDPSTLVLAGSPSGEEVIARKKLEAEVAKKEAAAVVDEDEDDDEEEDEEEEASGEPKAGPMGFPGWKELYEKGDIEKLPWFSEKLDKDLAAALDRLKIEKGKLLDNGTGPGTQAIALAKRGFDVTGSDLSPAAIEYATKRAKKEDAKVTFVVDDVLDTKLEGPFDVVFDRGCFHVLPPESRKDYVATMKKLIAKDGHLFLKTFSDEQPGTEGPHRFKAAEILEIFSGEFEIEKIEKTVYEGQLDPEPKALFIVCIPKG
jgi:2-polyprenyl-3-methyl-5-hydroxy-6-metoxy-1,4-benzoquinol methylase